MSKVEDRLRDVMAERAAQPPPAADPYAGVDRLIHRTSRRRAVAGGTALVAVAVTAVAIGLPGGGSGHGRSVTSPPAGPTLPVTLAPPAAGPERAQATVPVPAKGLTIVVDCLNGGGNDALVVRVNGREVTEVDCYLSDPAPTTLGIEPSDLRRYGLRAGDTAVVAVSDIMPRASGGKTRAWTVRVEAGAPRATASAAPRATALPPRPSGRLLLLSVAPDATAPNNPTDVSDVIAPDGGADVAVTCLYPGTVRVEIHDLVTRRVSHATVHCTGQLPATPGVLIPRTIPAGHAVTLRITPRGFTHPTWRVDVIRHQG